MFKMYEPIHRNFQCESSYSRKHSNNMPVNKNRYDKIDWLQAQLDILQDELQKATEALSNEQKRDASYEIQ